MDVTDWLLWLLQMLHAALDQAHATLDAVLRKTRFWHQAPAGALNERQVKVLNRLLDGFEGKLTTAKYAALAKCSSDTALRDLTSLVTLGLLRRSEAGGRSTHYELRQHVPVAP